MTVNEIAKQEFKKIKKATRMIGIYKSGEQIVPDYADEMLETYGNKEVDDYKLVQKNGMNILVVALA